MRVVTLGRIEPLDVVISTPDEYITFMDEIALAVDGLERDVSRDKEVLLASDRGRALLASWNAFKDAWRAWYRSHRTFTGALTGATEALNSWAERFNAFEAQLVAAGVHSTTPSVTRRRRWRAWIPWIVTGAVILGVAIAAYALVRSGALKRLLRR
jgi:hypothetical protein